MTTLRGSTSDFPLESVIGLLAGTSKTGELQIRSGSQVGALGFASGRLVAAVMESEAGENALGAIFGIGEADFEFTPWASAPDANLESGDLVSVLRRAAESRDRLASIREQIPSDSLRFRLSERAADQGAVTFTPERWRALLAVNGERDVAAIADQLRVGRMDTLTLLAGLVRDGVIEAVAPQTAFAPKQEVAREPEPAPVAEAAPPPPEPAAPTEPIREEEPAEKWWEATSPTPETAAPEVAEQPAVSEVPSSSDQAEPPTERRADLDAAMAERFSTFTQPEPPATEAPAAAPVPPAVDDRLSSLTGIFAPGPAANAPPPTPKPAEPSPQQAGDPWSSPRPAGPARPAESWTTAPPAASEAPANTWAPGADAHPPEPAPPAPPAASASEWSAPPPSAPASSAESEKKRSGLFGMFRREEPTPIAQMPAASTATSRPGLLASFSNALLLEYNSGQYGKGKIETRMANLLMRVDEQADPIDRPLPIVDDLIDATALERESFPEEQAVPYLATLVRQIYEDAERAYGKDKAKKGYKVAQQQVFRTDPSLLQSPELAGKLPKV